MITIILLINITNILITLSNSIDITFIINTKLNLISKIIKS